jgi:hypothetical protein
VSRLRAVVGARDAENSALRAGLEKVLARLDAALAGAAAEREQRERLELKWVAPLIRRGFVSEGCKVDGAGGVEGFLECAYW